MAALTASRSTKKMSDRTIQDLYYLPVAASTKVWQGGLVALNASGFAVPGSVATTLIAVGRAEESVDNSSGSNGAKFVTVRAGVFKWANSSAGDLIGQTEWGKQVFIVDDQTVAKTNGGSTRSVAGKVIQVDSDGVWVLTAIY